MTVPIAANMLVISAVCTGIIVLIIAVRKVLDKYTHTGWQTALWMVILIRLCVPYIAQTPIGIMDMFSAESNTAYIADAHNTIETADSDFEIGYNNAANVSPSDTAAQTAPKAAGKHVLSAVDFLGYMYLAGFIISLCLLIAKSILSTLHIRTLPVCTNSVINTALCDIKNEMGITRTVSILLSKNTSVPMVCGVFSSVIILPKSDQYKDISDIKIILTHELTHIKHMDILKLWLMELALCFNWFNPFMYLFKRVIIKDIEIACDQKVLAKGRGIHPYDYSVIIAQYCSLPKSKSVQFASIGFTAGRGGLLKDRLSTISRIKSKKQKPLGIILCMLISVLMIACTSTGLSTKDSFDLRDRGGVVSPQNQGQYSTGAVFAAMGIAESYIAKTTGQLINLSEQQFIDDTGYIKQNFGVSPEKVLDYIIQNGIVTERALPYTGIKGDGYSEISDSVTRYNIPAFDSIYLSGLSHDEQVEIVKDSLQQYGVVMTNIGYYKSMEDYTGGVFRSNDTEQAINGHWVNIVGYADDDSLPSGGYWIVKESWGSDWGDNGYIKIAYNDPCGINDYILYYISDETS